MSIAVSGLLIHSGYLFIKVTCQCICSFIAVNSLWRRLVYGGRLFMVVAHLWQLLINSSYLSMETACPW
jgi:hypothetical protein